MVLSAPARTSLLQLATQQLSRRPPPWLACRHPLYSTLPDPPANHTGPSIHQPKPAEKITPTPSSSSASSSQAAQEHSPEDAELPKPPPFLPRPLGVQDPPSTRPPTEEEKLAKLVDERARLQERKHLLINPSSFHLFFKQLSLRKEEL
jgi:ATPase complex subunit ATP10